MEGKQAGGRLLKNTPFRNYWAYLPNKRQKNVVPLQRNFKPKGGAVSRPHHSMPGCAGVPACFLFSIAAILVFLLLISLTSCKSPATLTNDTQHRTRDSNYHATVHRIETHDTIILGYYPSAQPKLSNSKLSNCPIVRISDRKITIRDTVFVSRTDTLLRTQTITQKERYIPPFYRFCTISFVTFVSFVTLAFSIHMLLRYLKRS